MRTRSWIFAMGLLLAVAMTWGAQAQAPCEDQAPAAQQPAPASAAVDLEALLAPEPAACPAATVAGLEGNDGQRDGKNDIIARCVPACVQATCWAYCTSLPGCEAGGCVGCDCICACVS